MVKLVRRALCGVILASGVALVAACGGGGDSGGEPTMDMGEPTDSATTVAAESTVTIQAINAYFVPDNITIPAGKMVELKLENMDGQEHDLQVDGLEVEMMSGGAMDATHESGGPGMLAVHTLANETSSVVFMATKPGTYDFYCTLPGHKDAGMVGKLTVE